MKSEVETATIRPEGFIFNVKWAQQFTPFQRKQLADHERGHLRMMDKLTFEQRCAIADGIDRFEKGDFENARK